MDTKKQRKILLLNMTLVACVFILTMFFVESTGAFGRTYKNIGTGVDLFNSVYTKVLNYYYEETDDVDLSKNAISGIVESLDPYSSFLEKVDYKQLEDDTKGEFGGLGIAISINVKTDYPTIMEYPIEDTPADRVKLRAGDAIVEVEGISTHKKPLTEVVGMLRGKVGTPVNIKIKRGRQAELLEYEIVRGKIPLHNISYSGEIVEGIGYIKLRRFNQEAAHELDRALDTMTDDSIKGVILDLRNNPGGLLIAAQEIANRFLPKDALIVFTRDRADNKREFKAMKAAKMPNKPLVVLVNRASASASEIVAGAIQDHDRGVLLGETTFGKGSVQTVFNDITDGYGLKLTTAHYFTPSSRSIHKERSIEDLYIEGDDIYEAINAEEDSVDTREQFETLKSHRIVYGGGGITPDIILKERITGNIIIQLVYQGIFSDFAVYYIEEHPGIELGFTITDEMLNDFKTYIADEENFEYSIPGKTYLEDFTERVELEKYNGEILGLIENIETALINKRDDDFEVNKETIKRFLKQELTAANFGSAERTIASKDWDVQLQKAIEILNDTEDYNSILSPGYETVVEN
ncbi:S41 family peptidase [Candidatus Latescibacterota bacterium]